MQNQTETGLTRQHGEQLYTINPPESLKDVIRFFWVIEGEGSPAEPYIHRSMAETSPQLFFQYQGGWDEIMEPQNDKSKNKIFNCGLMGPNSSVQRYSTSNIFGMIGAYLYPHAVPAIFNISTNDIVNRTLELKSVFGQECENLKEKIISATDNSDRLSILIKYLEKKPKILIDSKLISSIRFIINSKGKVDIPKLASNSFLSRRQFERRFKQISGFSPEKFCRIVRFNHLIGTNAKFDSLTDMAYAYGYYDQSHFIHEFKKFSGYTPRRYFSRQSKEAFYSF